MLPAVLILALIPVLIFLVAVITSLVVFFTTKRVDDMLQTFKALCAGTAQVIRSFRGEARRPRAKPLGPNFGSSVLERAQTDPLAGVPSELPLHPGDRHAA